MKEEILRLRQEGKTYTQIQDIVGCSRGTISYHCGEGQKEKTKERTIQSRRGIRSIVLRKIDLFLNRNSSSRLEYTKRTDIHEQMYNKIISNPICYITGERIDLSDSKSYSLDHINPYYISQDNSIENLGLTTKDANQSKSYLTLQQYLELCKKVVEFNRVMD